MMRPCCPAHGCHGKPMVQRSLYLILLLALLSGISFSLDPFRYTVDLKNFKDEIYRSDTSRYRITSSDTDFTLIGNRHQKVISRSAENGKKTVVIRAGAPAAGVERLDNRADYLRDTRFLNLSSPEIAGAAARLRGGADPVSAVESFVYGHIREKTLGIPLAPAARVYRMRRGDCTEHSVLAVALLRKLGVPARAIVGMYCTDEFLGRRNVFAYHMWAEAYWNGGWHLVDATRPGENRYNRYIALTEHNLRAEAPLPYLRAISAIQDLTVEYLGK